MIELVSTPREPLWAWVNSRIKIPWSSDFRAIGAVRDDCLQAVVVYNGFTGRTCFMHLAIDDPKVITRTFVRAAFEFPFLQCHCTHVFGFVDDDNKKAMDLDLHLGFKEVRRFANSGMSGKDLVLLEMAMEDCKWIGVRNGRQGT